MSYRVEEQSEPTEAIEPTAERESSSSQPPARLRDSGMATAEYAIATLAACGFAALLVVILSSEEVRSTLLGVIRGALALGG